MPGRGSATLRDVLRTLALAQLLALAVSTEYLFQPYIWRHWPIDEVLAGWLFILGDRAWIALLVVALCWPTLQVTRHHSLAPRAIAYGAAAVAGALLAEKSLQWMDRPGSAIDTLDLGLRVLRWSTLSIAVAGLLVLWRRALAADEAVRQEQQHNLAASSQLAGVRIQALQSQIEPHFLFNTLATVRRLGDTDPARGERLLAHLHDFVRLAGTAAPTAARWRLRDELQLVKAYLGVFELRMNCRLQSRYRIAPAALEAAVPPLALATLVENAIKHGITPATDGGEVEISASIEPATATTSPKLVLQVSDTGVGIGQATNGHGMGLSNTRSRLALLYGAEAQLQLSANLPRGVRATMRMPLEPA